MARYRFPVALGGLQYDAAAELPDQDDLNAREVGFDLPGMSKRLWIPRADLVKIEPPTPPLWSIVTIGTAIEGDTEPLEIVFHHRPFRAGGAWFRAGSSRAHSWAEVCMYGVPLVLTRVSRSTLRYAVEALSASGDNGDQYCASQIAEALGSWDERHSDD